MHVQERGLDPLNEGHLDPLYLSSQPLPEQTCLTYPVQPSVLLKPPPPHNTEILPSYSLRLVLLMNWAHGFCSKPCSPSVSKLRQGSMTWKTTRLGILSKTQAKLSKIMRWGKCAFLHLPLMIFLPNSLKFMPLIQFGGWWHFSESYAHSFLHNPFSKTLLHEKVMTKDNKENNKR